MGNQNPSIEKRPNDGKKKDEEWSTTRYTEN
jgi:hypothetical protein